eukprot:gene43664-4736_t
MLQSSGTTEQTNNSKATVTLFDVVSQMFKVISGLEAFHAQTEQRRKASA